MLGVIRLLGSIWRILLDAVAATIRKDRGKTCTQSQPMPGERLHRDNLISLFFALVRS